jgi:hypothetical protein
VTQETCASCGQAIGDAGPGHAWGEGVVCTACLARLGAPPAALVAYATPGPAKRTSGLGIASLVLGLVALPAVCIFALASVPLAFIGAALGAVALFVRKGEISRGIPIAGLIINGVILLICAAIAIFVLTMVVMR